jgi:GNAT superfamily N-acetyltransferase
MHITLRPVRANDRPFEIELMTATWQERFRLMPVTPEQRTSMIVRQVELQREDYAKNFPDARVMLIERDTKPIGRYIYASRPDEILFIDIAILPEHQSQGIGQQVIEPQLEEVRTTGKVAYLHVEKGNARAQALYDRLGFRLCGEMLTHFKMKLESPGVIPSSR